MKTHKPLPPFRLSSVVVVPYGNQTITPGNEAMIPVITPSEPPHVHLPFDTRKNSPYATSQEGTIKPLYRGKPYYVGGVHLFRYAGKWVFRESDQGRTIVFDADHVIASFDKAGKPLADAWGSVTYYLSRAIYGDLTTAGKQIVARQILAEFNAYAKQHAAEIDAAIREANTAQAEEEIEALEAEIATAETALAAKRAKLNALRGPVEA